jgi:short-subunit dehydrogenase
VDILVSNAAYQMSHDTLEEISDEEWEYTFATNISAMFFLVKAALPHMGPGGSIIGSSSVNSDMPSPTLAPYAATKAGVVTISEGLRAELEGSGVRVSVVCPSFFQSNLLENFRAPDPSSLHLAKHFMHEAKESATDIAEAIYRAVDRGEFLILPTREVRNFWRLKRWFPQLYFRKLMQRINGLGARR